MTTYCNDCKKEFNIKTRKRYCVECSRNRIKQSKLNYRNKHRNDILKYQKEYRTTHKQYFRDYHKKYYTNDKYYYDLDNLIKRKIRSHKAQDVKYNRRSKCKYISIEWIKNKLQKNDKCRYCDKIMKTISHIKNDPDMFTVERKDQCLPHIQLNCTLCCYKCNLSRGKKTFEKFKSIHKNGVN